MGDFARLLSRERKRHHEDGEDHRDDQGGGAPERCVSPGSSQRHVTPWTPNVRADRRAERVRSSLLFGGISVSPPSWKQFERPRKTRTDTNGGEIASIRCQHPVDVPSLSDSDDCAVDEPQVERYESRIEFEGTNDVGR